MEPTEIIKGKRILIVDDEQDVLDTLSDFLKVCKIDTAATYAAAKTLLETTPYDAVILDIMGVRGFDLLELANERGVPALMLTAHAFSEETLKQSAEQNAGYYVPKEKMVEIEVFLADVLEAVDQGKNPWIKCFERLGRFYDKRFGGKDWREKEKAFWEKRLKGYMV
jgi:DNA-binding response OmpR family regulator